MRKLTLEQKAKRYDYFEKAILGFLEKHIEEEQYNDSDISRTNVVEEWMDNLDYQNDLVPHGVYLLCDKICDEHFSKFLSIGDCCLKDLQKEYKEFEAKIGG